MGENAFRRPCNFKELRVVKRAHIMLTDYRFWGHASGPSSSGKTLPRSIYCWHGHAARRSALPRERFSRVPGMLNSSEVKVFHPT
jgi:hypothetical protein